LLEKTKDPDVTFASVADPSIDNPFSHPVTSVLKTDIEEFLLILNDFSNFSPTGNVCVPSPSGPTIVKFEKIAVVCGVLDEPVASLSDSKQFESPGASYLVLSRTASPN
jgi:hypothetical protein